MQVLSACLRAIGKSRQPVRNSRQSRNHAQSAISAAVSGLRDLALEPAGSGWPPGFLRSQAGVSAASSGADEQDALFTLGIRTVDRNKRRRGAVFLSDGGKDNYVAAILDASPEKLSFVLPRTIGATSGGIADLTRRELLRPKDFALVRHLGGNGLGLGNSRQQGGGSRYQESKGSATNSPIITHCQTPQLFAAITSGMPHDRAGRAGREAG
jgi:hypothetical protein